MKRLAIGLALASLVAVSCALSVAAASTYAGDANVTWVLSSDGTVGWLYVQNAGSVAEPVVRLALGAAAVIEGGYTTFWDGSYQYVLLPTALAPGSYVTLTLAGAGGTAIGLTGVELGSYYTWFTVPAGTRATVDTVVGGPVVVKSADGAVNTLFMVNPATAARFVRIGGSAVVVGGGLATLFSADGSYVYVDLGVPTVAGGVTAVTLLGGEVASAEFVVGDWVVAKSADGAVNTLFMVNPATAARFVRLSGSDVAVGSGYATFSDGSYLYVDLGVPTVAGGVTAVTLLGGEVASAEFGSWVLWSVAADATSAVLTVRNFGTSAVNQLLINFVRNAIVDLADSFVYKTNWTRVAFALTDTDARTWDAAVNGDGTMQRFWLPVEVLPFEYVIVKVTMASATEAIKVFKAQLGYFAP